MFAVIITTLFMNGTSLGIEAASASMPYEAKIFDDTKVHTIDIVVDEDDWSGLLENATDKEYISCSVVIDGEAYKNVAIRAKGNTSLSSVASMDSDRYSFKIEFDHYESGKSYYGLDKLSLNNIFQDSTYLKDYLSYHMMNEMGIAAPLSSFADIKVNGEAFGFYLAVEGVEESLVERNYGTANGNLYKPDNMQMGGGDNASGGKSNDNSASLKYTTDDIDDYNTIWNGAIFDASDSDKERLVSALKTLSTGEDLETAVDIESVLKYFVVHNYTVNFDSYTGNMLHNYYLYESDGLISMIPWDYNLAFGSFGGMGGGKTTSSNSATTYVNYPIDTPVSGASMEDRPLLNQLLTNDEYLALYHEYFDDFISGYFESGRFEAEFDRVVGLISSYVQNDANAFFTYDEFVAGAQTLKEFCLLRAESIRGQLDGNIPATTEGQSADSESLIDASSITISAIGTMGGGMGGNGFGGGKGDFSADDIEGFMPWNNSDSDSGSGFTPPNSDDSDSTADKVAEYAPLASGNSAESGQVQPDFGGRTPPADGEMPDFPDGEMPDGMTPPSGMNTDGENNTDKTDGENTESGETQAEQNQPQADNSNSQSGGQNGQGNRPSRGDGENNTNGGFGGNFGGENSGNSQTAQNQNLIVEIILVGGSVLLLIGAMIFVKKYRRF